MSRHRAAHHCARPRWNVPDHSAPAPAIDGHSIGRDESQLPAAAIEWDPWLAQTLYASLERWIELPREALDAELVALEGTFGDSLYSEAIFILSHLRLPSGEAKRCWGEILDLREEMGRKLRSFVDLRVALATYFVHVNRLLHNPKIIELRLFERQRAFAYRDDLTELYNHRFFEESLAQEVLRAGRTNTPVSLIMIDIDDFKQVNDTHGHEAGNEAVAAVGRLIATAARREDIPARYGGEEFATILPATSKIDALVVAERIRAAIEEHDFALRDGAIKVRLSVSVGIATCPGDAEQSAELVRCADRALYGAKSSGKNQVQLYGRSRRSFPRFRTRLSGRYRALGPEFRPLTTADVSEGGMLFVCEEPLCPGTLVEFRLDLPTQDGTVSAVGRVVYVLERDGAYETAVRTIHIERRDLHRLSGFVSRLRPERGNEGEDEGR